MKDAEKTKEQLIRELEELRRQIAELEISEKEHKRVEKVLWESGEGFFETFHQDPIPMIIIRLPESRIIEVNNSFLQMVEYMREEVIGHTSIELNLLTEPDNRSGLVRSLLDKGSVKVDEVTVKTKTGKLLSLIASSEKVIINGQDHAIQMAVDITQRKQADEKLKESE